MNDVKSYEKSYMINDTSVQIITDHKSKYNDVLCCFLQCNVIKFFTINVWGLLMYSMLLQNI